MTKDELLHEMPKGLIKWYPFREGGKALYVSAGTEFDRSLCEVLTEGGLCTDCIEPVGLKQLEPTGYDYAILADAIVCAKDAQAVLKSVYRALKTNATLLLCVENRLGIRYFCGDKDPYTGRNFDSIENYKRISPMDYAALEGKLYDKAELTRMLEKAGFKEHRFYSVFPELKDPQILFAEDYVPEEKLNIRIIPQYHDPSTIFLEEENLYETLIENDIFHTMANAFVVECAMNGQFANANQITISMDRGKKNALSTIITRDGRVEKRPIYRDGLHKVWELKENSEYLRAHGIRMIDADIVGDAYVMPYVHGIPLAKYFCRLAETDISRFYQEFDRLWELTLASSEHVPYEDVDWERFNPWWDEEKDEKKRSKFDRSQWRRLAFGTDEEREELGVILKRGYIDLVLLNGFMVDGEFVFFDQEMYQEDMPAKAILIRNINFLYQESVKMNRILPYEELLARYHIGENRQILYDRIGYYLTKLRNSDILYEYHVEHLRDNELVHSNRQRMNYSALEYQNLFVDIFRNVENKGLYLFGAGRFAEKFIELYQDEYEISGILDNNESRWGTFMEGTEMKINPPSILQSLDSSTYKVIICIKNYTGVLKQVRELGAKNIGIYQTNMEYPRKPKLVGSGVSESKEKKKYHVGYVAGVFDLFHIGHLNLLRRAKEQCDYLIVGVVTDEGVRRIKRTDSFIPFEERIEVVRACRYVDEAVGIPLEYADTIDAYRKFQFDVQFSGSDYSNDSVWLEKRDFLREHGAELVFFPYTESTSSTKIKEMINRKLL